MTSFVEYCLRIGIPRAPDFPRPDPMAEMFPDRTGPDPFDELPAGAGERRAIFERWFESAEFFLDPMFADAVGWAIHDELKGRLTGESKPGLAGYWSESIRERGIAFLAPGELAAFLSDVKAVKLADEPSSYFEEQFDRLIDMVRQLVWGRRYTVLVEEK